MPYINVLQSLTSGPLAWVDSGLVPSGAEALLNKPAFSETLTSSDATAVPALVATSLARTAVFTAPVDCTVRNLIFTPTSVDSAGTHILYSENAYNFFLGKITIAGTGPDVGQRVEGFGIPAGLFALPNLQKAPQLDFRLDAGDTISITFYFLGAVSSPPAEPPSAYHAVLTYDLGQDTSVTPGYFIGGATAPGAVATVTPTAATGTLQITGTPTSPGDYISLNGYGDGINQVGGILQGVAGGGGVGTNTWDTNTVGVTNIRDAILTALQDNTNDFDGGYTFASVSTDSISVTRNTSGPVGNFDNFLTNSASISLTGSGNLSGAVEGSTNIALQTPANGFTLERVYAFGPTTGTLPALSLQGFPLKFATLNVGGSPVSDFPGVLFPPDATLAMVSKGSLPISASTTLSVDVTASYGTSGASISLFGRR